MRFDLTDLRLFVAVVERGSITAGARAANMALASASARVGGMERSLGVPLLDRGRRGVVPTAAGTVLLDHARAIGARAERMQDDLRAFSSGLRGEVRLLVNTAALVELVPRALLALLAEHPEIDVELEEHSSVAIAVMLADGRGDLGVAADSADLGALDTIPLAEDRLVAVVPPGHILAGRDHVQFAELLDHRFVGLREGALHDHLAANAARRGRRVRYRVRVASFANVIALVATGIGVAVVPQAAADRCSAFKAVVLPLTDPWATRRLVACARSLTGLGRNAQLILASLIERSDDG